MNKALLIGRLTKDPELRATSTGRNVCQFSIAVNRNFTNANGEREADFINIIVWRKQAEVICNYFDKGNQIAIEGRLQTGSYDAQDGSKRYTTDVVLDQFHFIESRAQREASTNNAVSDSVSPYDYQESNDVSVENDPFADFGDSVSIDDNFLD